MIEIRCVNCNYLFPSDSIPYRCPECGGIFDFTEIPIFDPSLLNEQKPGIWKYRYSFGLNEPN